jgi:4-amino-4-deoxy-L-arabinose transferase-like glycosyltransferase
MQPVNATKLDVPTAPSSRDNTKLHIVPVLGIALLARITVLTMVIRSNPTSWFFEQATELAALAHSVTLGQGLSSPFGGSTGPSAFLTPGYPLLVAAIFRVFGSYTHASEVALVAIQALFGVTTVLVIMLVARRLFGSKEGNIAGILWAISPAVLWLPLVFWESSFSALALITTIYLGLLCVDRPITRRWLTIGVYTGLILLVNPSLMLALVSIIVWMGWMAYGASAWQRSGPAIAILACILVFSPWPIRNLYSMHAFIPLRPNMGYELWQGNRPGANGFFSVALHPNVNKSEFEHYASLGELGYMREKSALARVAIQADTRRFIRLTCKRTLSFWTGISNRPTSFLVVGYILFTTLLGMVGFVLLLKHNYPMALLLGLPLLLFPLPYYVTHPDARFRLVIDPIAAVLTSYALVELNNRLSRVPVSHPRRQK